MKQVDELPAPRSLLAGLTLVGAFVSTFITGAAAVATPAIGASLHFGFSTAIFMQAAYLLTATVFLIPAGRFADAHSRLDYYIAGIGVFGVSSLLAGFAPNADLLIAARAFQGFGAALVAATTEAVLVTLFPEHERGRAIGINVTVVYVGVSLGPVVGGFLTESLGWRWIFFVNAPIALATVILLWRLRWDREPRTRLRLDLPGSMLLAAWVTPLVVVFSYAPLWGWSSTLAVSLLIGGIAALGAFILVEARVDSPILDLDLLRGSRLFTNAAVCTLLNAFSVFSVGLLVALFLQIVQHHSVATTGLLMLSQPIVMAGLSPVFGQLSDRVGSRALTTVGMVTIAGALFLLAALPGGASAAWIVLCLGLLGIGMAAFSSPNEAAALGAAPRVRLGAASSILGSARYIGQFLSLSVLGAVAASQLGAAGTKVIFLHDREDAISSAYVSGFRIAFVVAGAVALVTALIAWRRTPPRAAPEGATSGW